MMDRKTFFQVSLAVLCLVVCYLSGTTFKTLRGLRYNTVNGTVARFIVDRKFLENELNSRKKQDPICGKDVALELPGALPHASYDSSRYGEVVVVYLTFNDATLREELPCHLKDKISASFTIVAVQIPCVIGGEPGFIPLVTLSDSEKIALDYQSSFKKIDSIHETEDGTVTLRHGDDVMIFQTGGDIVKCHNDKVGGDFDVVEGKLLKSTDYPREFNWGCDLLGDDVGYCRVLREHQCELQRLGGDVCVLTHSPISERCPSFMRIERLTGFFRDTLFLSTESTPVESLEAEWIKRDHEMGIQFPCLS